jgi:glycyl-tRNA synthetase
VAQQSTGVQTLEKIVSLAKRRGFIFQSSEIYGGLNGCWDYGPLGVEMLRNIKEAWWRTMTHRREIEGLDAAILMHPKVWEASGHVQNFSDPMVDCKSCKARFRVDILFNELSDQKKEKVVKSLGFDKELKDVENILKFTSIDGGVQVLSGDQTLAYWKARDSLFAKVESMFSERFDFLVENEILICPNCGNKKTLTSPRNFNLMFETYIGPVKDTANAIYLRPETAQGIFVNVLNVMQSSRQKLPFGIAQIGKAFRNEINTKNFLFRTREFEQMEMQYFVKEGTDEKFYEEWREQRYQWWISLGIPAERLHLKPHEKLAHYAKAAIDIEFEFPFGFGEIEGIHNRTNFDLSRHEEFSGKSLSIHDEDTKEKKVPFVIETSAGASRGFMAFLCNGYGEENVNGEVRTTIRLHPLIAPVKAAILPLVNKDGMQEIAEKLETDLRPSMKTFYDDSGAVGRRYRRQDEIGTPFCVTIDSETLENQTVTIRERDSMEQIRLPLEKVKDYISEKIKYPV